MPRPARSRLTANDLIRLRLPSEAAISPDGRYVVFVERTLDLEHNRTTSGLRLVDVESGVVRQWTTSPRRDSDPCWTPDSRHVIFASDRGGAEALWRIGIGDREPEKLTALSGRVRQPRVAPDGRSVAFVHAPARDAGRNGSAGPEFRHHTRLRYKHDGRGFHDDAWTHIWVLDLGTRKVRRLTSGEFDDSQPAWSPDGRSIVFVSNRIARADVHFANADLFVVAARGGGIRRLTHELGPKASPAWSPDGSTIAFVGHTRFPDTVENVHIWVVPARRGPARDLMPDADLMCDDALLGDSRDVDGTPPRPVWAADGRRIFFIATERGAANIWEIASRGGTPRQRTFGAHEIPALSQSASGRRWAFVRSTPTSPGEIYVATATQKPDAEATRSTTASLLPGARVERLTRLNDALLGRRHLAVPEEMRIACKGGHEVQGWVLRAAGKRPGPAVLMLHGGPYSAYGSTFFHELQMLAGAGYHVFYTNPRGSVGYGRDFMRSLVGQWGHADSEDLHRISDAIESLPFVDPRRIALAGGSYGGYLTSWALTHTQRYKCAISMRGISNLVSMYGTSDMGWDLTNEFEAQAPWLSLDRWWRVSPLAHVEKIRTPLLLLHSDNDLRCPVGQAEELFTALRVLGRDVELVRFMGESHGLSRGGRPHNRLERLRRILDWFERKL